jgi:two-component system cell cycle sensor histidine kinase/response regulator CckA
MNATLPREEGGPSGAVAERDARGQKNSDEQNHRSQRLESIGMLASGIAHDLNNVLSPIILAAPILRGHATDPEDIRLITSLEKNAERGVELVRQILSFAHGASGIRQLVHIKELMKEASTLASDSFPKNIRVLDQIPDNLWPTMADPTQIHQVLLNLCVNARDAMPAGGTLTLGAENSLLDETTAGKITGGREGAWVVLQVEDTGPGIPPENLSQIWEPFFTTKEDGKGTGLGLSTVRSIVENHNGFISLKTNSGRGTLFRVYLPAAEVATQRDVQGVIRPKSGIGSGELVMVVDDDPQIRDVTCTMLSRNGYRTLSAGDGTQAVALFAARRHEISLVITDLVIPHLDGVALARIVQNLNPRVKILAMSGMASDGRRGNVERFGGSFLFKPFKAQTLLNEVYSLLHPAAVAEVA